MSKTKNEMKKFSYKGEVYYFSHGTWLDHILLTVPDEIGIELAHHFKLGQDKYHYYDQKVFVRTYGSSDRTNSCSAAAIIGKHKATLEKKTKQEEVTPKKETITPDEKLKTNERITLAKYFGVKSSLYRKVTTKSLGFASIIMNRFTYYGIDTLEKLLNMTWEEVKDIRVIKDARARQIEETLRDYLAKNTMNLPQDENKGIQDEKRVLIPEKKESVVTKPVVEEPIIEVTETKDTKVKKDDEAERDTEVRRLKAALAVACCVILVLLCKLIMVYYF